MSTAEIIRKTTLKALGIGAGCQPKVKAGIDRMDDLLLIKDPTGIRNRRFAGNEGLGGVTKEAVIADQREDA
jgi:hypothetical protein